MTEHRGSRRHVLEWVRSPSFILDLNVMLSPAGAIVGYNDAFMPTSENESEARLETFGPKHLEGILDWSKVRDWWLAHTHGANTPNWDLAATCTIRDRRGLVLVEAKAHVSELSPAGKTLRTDRKAGDDGSDPSEPSVKSRDNHDHIGAAITEANTALAAQVPGIALSRGTHYQLSNRIAFAWKLASLGLPVVLVYLGFTGDLGIKDSGLSLSDDAQWKALVSSRLQEVGADDLRERAISCGPAPFWLLVRSRAVMSQSPAQARRSSPSAPTTPKIGRT